MKNNDTRYLTRPTQTDHFEWLIRSGMPLTSGLKVLDLGCAGGDFLKVMYELTLRANAHHLLEVSLGRVCPCQKS